MENPLIERRTLGVDWSVYVILDPGQLPGGRASIEDVAEAALRGGAGVLQLRDKRSSTRELVEVSRALTIRCRAYGAIFVVNDRLDVALAAGADGVHLGPSDLRVGDARRIAPGLVIGASAGTVEDARRHAIEGADYLGVGAIYDAHASKADASAPRGAKVVTAIREEVDVALVGIGGITAKNAGDVIAAGADGVAVIREVLAAEDPREATAALLASVQQARG